MTLSARQRVLFPTIALSVFLIATIMGVTGQYIAGGLALLIMAFGLGPPGHQPWRQAWQAWRWPCLFALAFVLWLVVAGYSNPAIQEPPWLAVAGYVDWVLWGPLIACWVKDWRLGVNRGFWRVAIALVFVWAGVCLSQYLTGWKLQDFHIEPDIKRARGFVSHPLTLAYMALVAWPVALEAALKKVGGKTSWFITLGVAIAIFTSLSRTVQVLALAYGLLRISLALPRRHWPAFLMAVLLGGLVLGLTDNPVRQRFTLLAQGQFEDRHQSLYADDRLAFWAAHRLMIEERPFMGHGPDLDQYYRWPYYERLGLGDFIKKYEAHNQYLQILTEGGLIGLALWSMWLIALWRLLWRQAPRTRLAMAGMVLLFLLGGLTQNAFQDSEVRFTFMVLGAFLWVFGQEPDRGPLAIAASPSAGPQA